MKNTKRVEAGDISRSFLCQVEKKIAEISTDIRELVGARKKKNDAEKFAKWKEILEKIEKKNKNTV